MDATTSFPLEARERLLSEAERIAHVGSFAWDVRSDVIHWSDELRRILGYEDRTIVPTQAAFFGAIDPDDVARVQSVASRALETGVADSVEFRLIRTDGIVRHVRMSGAAMLDDAGRPTRFVGAVIDLTERVVAEAEARRREDVLRLAQRIARVGSFEWNPWTGVTSWSETLHDICGVPVSEPGTQSRYFELVHPDDRDRLNAVVSKIGPDDPIPAMEYRLVRPDGGVVDVYAEGSPIRDREGKHVGFVGTVLDITQRKRLEAELLQSQKMDALGRLAGGIAHDFNNLLAVIGLHADVLRRRRGDGELLEIARAVERAAELTRRLLAFSRQGTFARRRIDPAPLVCDSLRMLRPIVGDDVDLSFAAASDIGAVEIDPSQLEQVLMNLVVNARNAVVSGGHVAVTLSATTLDASPEATVPAIAPGEYVVLGVSDDGVGMDESVRRRVFEPFFTTKKSGDGTGLGMAMVFGIVSGSDGGISVTSATSEGTHVRVYLPRFPLAPDAPATTEHEQAPPRGAGEHILLVDDNPAILRILTAVLEDAGYIVHPANDGAAALERVERLDELALVVTDVVMPSIGGVELVRRLREHHRQLPALYVSGFSREGPADEDLAAYGTLLRKPFLPLDLLRSVATLLRPS